jgi:hypothetical protein
MDRNAWDFSLYPSFRLVVECSFFSKPGVWRHPFATESGYGGSVFLDFLSGAHERFLLSTTASSISASAPQLPLRL